MNRMVLPFIALAAGGVAALMFAVPRTLQIPSAGTATVDAKGVATAAPPAEARDQGAADVSAAQSEAGKLAAAIAGPPPAPGGDQLPEFDVVRIEPNGEAVVAGRAAPGATVELLRNGEPHDRVVADQSGQFAMIPRALPPGNYDLTLRARKGDGSEVVSRQSVAVALEPTPNERPIVALMSPDKPTRVLSTPPTSGPVAGKVVVEAVETEANGKLHVSGRARPGASARLYLNDSFVASATAGDDGRLSVTINAGVKPGGYRVRLDEVDSDSGAVRGRAEVPFNVPDTIAAGSLQPQTSTSSESQAAVAPRPRLAAADSAAVPNKPSQSSVIVPKVMTATVSRGDSLWRISQRALGAGQRYVVIYRANKTQIRNPNLIHPGQVFVMPTR